MRKVLLFVALWFSALSFATVNITVNPNVIDFGTVNLNADGEATGDSTVTLSWSGLIEYCSVFVDTIYVSGANYDNCEFYATAFGGADYWYGGDQWNVATDPTVYVGYYAIYPGDYTIKYSFYSFTDDNWTIKSQGAELTLKVKVQAIGTDVESVEANGKAHKVVRDGQIYIIRGEKMYDLSGKIAQ